MVDINNIEGVVIRQSGNTYKLIKRETDWIFVDLKDMCEYGGHTKESAYKIICFSNIISIPVKIYELWT